MVLFLPVHLLSRDAELSSSLLSYEESEFEYDVDNQLDCSSSRFSALKGRVLRPTADALERNWHDGHSNILGANSETEHITST